MLSGFLTALLPDSGKHWVGFAIKVSGFTFMIENMWFYLLPASGVSSAPVVI